MYIDSATIKRGNKTYHRRLLRTSFRENGKVRHKTLLNLSNCTNEEVAALEIALKHKGKLESLTSLNDFESKQGKRIGAAWTLNTIAKRIGITKALGSNRQAKLALLQVIARIIYQGSRLSAVRLAMSHALCETIGIDTLNKDDLWVPACRDLRTNRVRTKTSTKNLTWVGPLGEFFLSSPSFIVNKMGLNCSPILFFLSQFL